MAFMLWLLLTLQVWKGLCQGPVLSCSDSSMGDDSSPPAPPPPSKKSSAGDNSQDLVLPGSAHVTEFFTNMSKDAQTFDRVSYHRQHGVVLRGVFNNKVCTSIGEALPEATVACFKHDWIEFHLANPKLPARTLVNRSTELQAVQLHFMDNGMRLAFGNSSGPETEFARSSQVIDPTEVMELAQDPQRPVWRPFTHNCQDVAFQSWGTFSTESNAVPKPFVTKITAVVVDTAVLVGILLLICFRKKCFKRNAVQDLGEPFLD